MVFRRNLVQILLYAALGPKIAEGNNFIWKNLTYKGRVEFCSYSQRGYVKVTMTFFLRAEELCFTLLRPVGFSA